MEERAAAARDLERIRILMERAGRYSNLSGYAALTAGVLVVAGAVLCWRLRVNFNHAECARPLAAIWGSVFLLAVAQAVGFTILGARRKGEPAWSHLSRQVVMAMVPALFMGGAITAHGLLTGRLDLLPPIWMLGYGSSLMGLGLYAGGWIRATGLLFLFLGAASLFFFREYGLRMMLVSFGGLHLLLGTGIAWKYRA